MSSGLALPARRENPKVETASGRLIELPNPMAGPPVGTGGTVAMLGEARAAIRVGDLGEALIWIERFHPAFDGIRALVERTLNGDA